MKLKIGGIFIVSLFLLNEVNAQAVLNGTVYDIDTKIKLSDVLVRNIKNKKVAITRKSGNFTIPSAVNDILIFVVMDTYQILYI